MTVPTTIDASRRVDDLVKAMGIEGMSKSEVSRLAASSTGSWPSSGNAPLTRAPIVTCGSTPSPSGYAKAAGW